jgi:Fe-S-cluster-containing dehydrogenase component
VASIATPSISEPKGLNVVHVRSEIRNDPVISVLSGSHACTESAACINVCPSSAIYKDSGTGITWLIARCLGCKACLWACPFSVPTYDEEGKLELCDLCVDRLRGGKKTACEAACQARAIFVGSPEDIKQLRAKDVVKRMAESTGELGLG